MRLEASNIDNRAKALNTAMTKATIISSDDKKVEPTKKQSINQEYSQQVMLETENQNSKEKIVEAVTSINEFLELQDKSSKFVFHEGLEKYYVKLVDAKTEEVIREIPPERLLNAFYEMQKLAGMIVDEKI